MKLFQTLRHQRHELHGHETDVQGQPQRVGRLRLRVRLRRRGDQGPVVRSRKPEDPGISRHHGCVLQDTKWNHQDSLRCELRICIGALSSPLLVHYSTNSSPGHLVSLKNIYQISIWIMKKSSIGLYNWMMFKAQRVSCFLVPLSVGKGLKCSTLTNNEQMPRWYLRGLLGNLRGQFSTSF